MMTEAVAYHEEPPPSREDRMRKTTGTYALTVTGAMVSDNLVIQPGFYATRRDAQRTQPRGSVALP
jgi:hypothetical protein